MHRFLSGRQIAEIVKRNKGYAHSTAAARCLAIKYPFLEAEVVFAVEQVPSAFCRRWQWWCWR